jgi:predicted aconitase
VPYKRGLDQWLGTKLDAGVKDYFKDMGAATASNGAVGLYHVAHLTPEAVTQGEKLIAQNAKVYVIDDAELERVKKSYPVIWKKADASPKLCFIGCPHLSHSQLLSWTAQLLARLESAGRRKVAIPVVFTAAPAVLREFRKTEAFANLTKAGVITSDICPLMYMNNPLCGKMPVITNSNKLRTYTSARYYTDDEILSIIAGSNGGAK